MDNNDIKRITEYTSDLASALAPNALKLIGKKVHFIGTGPFTIDDLMKLLPSEVTTVIDEPVDNPDFVVFGYENFQVEQIEAAVMSKKNRNGIFTTRWFPRFSAIWI